MGNCSNLTEAAVTVGSTELSLGLLASHVHQNSSAFATLTAATERMIQLQYMTCLASSFFHYVTANTNLKTACQQQPSHRDTARHIAKILPEEMQLCTEM